MAYALQSQGAVPNLPKPVTRSSGATSTAKGFFDTLAKNFTSPNLNYNSFTPDLGNSSPGTVGGFDRAPLGKNPGLISQHKPDTPVKKITDTSGNVVEFHAPKVVAPDDAGNMYNTETGAKNPNYKDPNAPAATQPTQTQATTPTKSPDQAKIISDIQAAGKSTPEEDYWKKQYVDSVKGTQFGKLAPYAEASMYAGKTPEELQGLITAPDLAGRSSADTGLYNTLGSAYGNAALAGLTASQVDASRNLSANTTAGQLNAPVTQFGQLTNPVTGGVIGAGTSGNNPALEGAVQRALQMVDSGASIADAQASLGGYGQAGINAFNQAQQERSGGTYNPTAANAIANSNTEQGINYKQAAIDLDTSLKQLDTASELAENFLNTNNLLNSTDNPHFNDAINTYIGTYKDPAARLQYNAILGDIKKFTSTILASNNGTIPTDVTNTLATFDPSTLNAMQLKPYLESLAQLGNNQKSIIQGQVDKLLPNQGNNYTGSPTNISTTPIATPKSNSVGSGIDDQDKNSQALFGTFMGLTGGVSGLASKVFSNLFHQ